MTFLWDISDSRESEESALLMVTNAHKLFKMFATRRQDSFSPAERRLSSKSECAVRRYGRNTQAPPASHQCLRANSVPPRERWNVMVPKTSFLLTCVIKHTNRPPRSRCHFVEASPRLYCVAHSLIPLRLEGLLSYCAVKMFFILDQNPLLS